MRRLTFERPMRLYDLAYRMEMAERRLTVDKIVLLSEEERVKLEKFRKLVDATAEYFEKVYEPISMKKVKKEKTDRE